MNESKAPSIKPDVVETAVMLGLCDNEAMCTTVINRLVQSAAPVTHPAGNLRHNEWIFKVTKGVVEGVGLIHCTECNDKKRVMVWDECQHCEGEGCQHCHWDGARQKSIPCQSCK